MSFTEERGGSSQRVHPFSVFCSTSEHKGMGKDRVLGLHPCSYLFWSIYKMQQSTQPFQQSTHPFQQSTQPFQQPTQPFQLDPPTNKS